MCCVNTGSDIDYGLRNRTQILGVSIYNGTRLKRTKLNRKQIKIYVHMIVFKIK